MGVSAANLSQSFAADIKVLCVHRLIEVELNQPHQPFRDLRDCSLWAEADLERVQQCQTVFDFEIGTLFNQRATCSGHAGVINRTAHLRVIVRA